MYLHNIIHRHCAWLIATIASIALFTACTPDKGINANLFAIQPEALTIVEGETATITVSGGTDFDISTDNSNATCVKNSDATISVTGLKVGTCTLTVTKGNESLSCKITIERSAAQKRLSYLRHSSCRKLARRDAQYRNDTRTTSFVRKRYRRIGMGTR